MAVRFIFLNQAWRLNGQGREPGDDLVVGLPVPQGGVAAARPKRTHPTVLPRKAVPVQHVLTVPQTDTGRQVEDTKVFERTLVKELGNLTP